MRTLSTAMAALLASGEQVEPVTIVAIKWNDLGTTMFYADRDLRDGGGVVTVPGKILEMGSLDESQRSDSTGAAGSVSIVLDDRDGSLKSIFNGTDIHLKHVDIFQSFMNLASPNDDKILVFSGQVSTPIVWDEGKRTLSFDVVTKLEDREVGWSAELGDYKSVAQELLGRPWPLVFGTVHHSPGLRLQDLPTAFTTAPFGIRDRTLENQINVLGTLLKDAILATLYYSLLAGDPGDPLDFGGHIPNDPKVKEYVKMQADIQDQINLLQRSLEWQAPYGVGQVGLVPTTYVTQPYAGAVRAGNTLFGASITKDGGWLNTEPIQLAGAPAAGAGVKEGFQFFPAGTQVAIASRYPLKYIVSVVPGVILKVWAMRSWNGTRQMAEVPPSYYSWGAEPIGNGMSAVSVTLIKPLSTIAFVENLQTQTWENTFGKTLPPHIVNQVDWEDEIYVSFQSDIGPGPVDIMIWLIDNFSSNTYDRDSFNAVKLRTDSLPMGFTLAEMPNVMDLLAEIAYQARCLIYLRNDVFYLLFLPGVGSTPLTLSEDDIMVDSLRVTCTPTENLITKYVATYRPDYSPFFSEPVKLIMRYNVPRYGVHEQSHDFYAYNTFPAVSAAATYWMIQKSQTWKILQARLLLTRLDIEVFDYVTLHFATPYVASEDVTGLVTKCTYDSANKWIDVEIWCPVLLGEMKANPFAFPAGTTQITEWPQYRDRAGAGGQSLSSPALPPSNSRSEEAGQLNVGGPLVRNQGPISLGWYSTGEDWAPPLFPVFPDSKAFPRTPLTSHDPTLDYKFTNPPDPTIVTKSGMFPGKVGAKVGPSKANPGMVDYAVEVYENGLSQKPVARTVSQLQIDPDDTIPTGTWTFVDVNQGTVTGDDGKPKPYTDRTMQLPTWLS